MPTKRKRRREITILSLGGRVQSTTLALLLDDGELAGYRKPDAAIFADTGAEGGWVYENIERLRKTLTYPVVTTAYSNLETDTRLTLDREATIKRPAQYAESIFLDIPT